MGPTLLKMAVRRTLILLFLFFTESTAAAPDLRWGQSYERNELQKLIREYAMLDSEFSAITTKPLSVSLTGHNVELLTAEDSCGSGGCQFFVVKRYAEGRKIKFKLLAEFFGHFKLLEKSSKGYRHIEVQNNVGGDKSKYVLKFNGDYFAP